MPSLSKVISNIVIDENNPMSIETTYVRKVKKEESDNKTDISENEIYRRYESVAQKIIDNAKEERDSIIAEAYKNAVEIEKNAFDKGYKNGFEEGKISGQDEGYKKCYEDNLEPAKKEAQNIIENAASIAKNAENLLINSNNDYVAYLSEKKDEIKDVILAICENILKNELSNPSMIDNMIFDVIDNTKNIKSFAIRCNSKYLNDVKGKISEWKNALSSDIDIFAVCDENVEDGSAVIIKSNGKAVVGINEGMSKIKDILYGNI